MSHMPTPDTVKAPHSRYRRRGHHRASTEVGLELRASLVQRGVATRLKSRLFILVPFELEAEYGSDASEATAPVPEAHVRLGDHVASNYYF